MSHKEESSKPKRIKLNEHVSMLQCILQAQQLNFDVVADGDLIDSVGFIWLMQERFATGGFGYNWLTRSGMDWLEMEERALADDS